MNRVWRLLIFLPFLSFTCYKKERLGGCLQGKVVRITCASTVVQVMNNDSIGDDGWNDTFTPPRTYDNVFSVSNKCEVPSKYKVGDTFYFHIGKPKTDDCIVCMMYDAPPKSKYPVVNISDKPCE